jgi:hypothetical protein
MRVRFAEDQGIELEGTAAELQSLYEAVSMYVRGGAGPIIVEADTSFDPAPYAAALPRLVITRVGGPARVSVHSGEMHIEGSEDALDAFASFLMFGDEATLGSHSHFEYYEGNPIIAPESEPLVITVA